MNSNAGAVILKITYGWTVTSNDDQLVNYMKEGLRIVTEIVQPGRWLVEILPLLRFVPTWVPGAGFQRKAAYAKQRLTHIESFPFDWTKEQIVRYGFAIDYNLLVTDSVLLSPRNLGITLTRSSQWVFVLTVTNHPVQTKKTSSGGVVPPCTQVAPIL
jgi:hypothetical protein